MSRRTKIGAVAGGYVLALVAARVAAWLYDLRVSALPYDTSGGMYAFGQMSAALSAFLLVACRRRRSRCGSCGAPACGRRSQRCRSRSWARPCSRCSRPGEVEAGIPTTRATTCWTTWRTGAFSRTRLFREDPAGFNRDRRGFVGATGGKRSRLLAGGEAGWVSCAVALDGRHIEKDTGAAGARRTAVTRTPKRCALPGCAPASRSLRPWRSSPRSPTRSLARASAGPRCRLARRCS
jgi:hypothetical protein